VPTTCADSLSVGFAVFRTLAILMSNRDKLYKILIQKTIIKLARHDTEAAESALVSTSVRQNRCSYRTAGFAHCWSFA
jgi:hypothetical protein